MNSRRHTFATFCFVVVVVLLFGKMGYITIFERYFLQDQSKAQSERSQSIPVHRGMIFDRLGEPLAISTPVIAVTVNPSRLAWTKEEFKALADILDTDSQSLAEKVANGKSRSFLYLARRLPAQKALPIQQLNLADLEIQTEYRRYYPMGEVAAHLTGITDVDERGLEGLEQAFDSHLDGEVGSRRVVRDREGRLISDVRYERLPKFGEDLVTSIDSRLQFLAHNELLNVVKEFNAAAASVILLDVPSGGILALANVPSYNPNSTTDLNWAHVRNRVVTDLVEPGSTFKPFVAIAALESGRYQDTTEINTNPGWTVVRSKTIEDPVNYGVLTLRGVLVKSSQVGATRLALDLEPFALLDVHERAGFLNHVMAGLPGETAGIRSDDDITKPLTRATMSFGYGFSVTLLQLARGYLSLATGGLERQVSILLDDERRMSDVRVFERQHALLVLDMLSGVTMTGGTASKAAIPNFTSVGKTGTVRKLSTSGYTDRSHKTLFVGMVPMRNPQFLGVVLVDEPKPRHKGEKMSGGAVAAPVFQRIATRALQLRGFDQAGMVASMAEPNDAS